jgi:hypothetical protein
VGRRLFRRWWHRRRRECSAEQQRKLVVLEIGCGRRIPTCRQQSERIMRRLRMGQGRLIRINPDFEGADSNHPTVSTSIISIKETALAALRKIDRAMQSMVAAEAADNSHGP